MEQLSLLILPRACGSMDFCIAGDTFFDAATVLDLSRKPYRLESRSATKCNVPMSSRGRALTLPFAIVALCFLYI